MGSALLDGGELTRRVPFANNSWNLGKKEGRGLPQNRAPFSFLLYCYPNLPLREKV